ncbi:MAG: DUF2288 domain-containing protein [Gammaproteobacteria bacterium]|nr:DUF2288 domain-containing protein [Gammaproteobacteria bacterium]
MTHDSPTPEQIARGRILSETAKLGWGELMREFASGKTLTVDTRLDLVEVAYQLEQDNSALVAQWLEAKQIRPVGDDEARQWYEQDQTVWACVVKPWILIQVTPPG